MSRIKQIIEIQVDLAHPAHGLALGIEAVVRSMPSNEGKLHVLKSLQSDIDAMIKGVESSGKPIRKSSREQQDK